MTYARRITLLTLLVLRGSVAAPPAPALVFAAKLDDNWDIFFFESGRLERLSKTPVDERGPSLSADRAKIAYSTSDGALWMLDRRSGVRMELGGPPGHYGYPAWVPGKDEIVYTLYSFTPPSEDADFYRCVITPRNCSLFIRQTGPQDYIAFSPRGDRVAYVSSVATLLAQSFPFVSQQVWVMSLQSGQPRPLFWGSSKNSRPAWSPDGERLAFSSDRSGNPQIWVADLAKGDSLAQLTAGKGDKISPCWAEDGRLYYVSNESGTDEIYSLVPRAKEVRKEKPFGPRAVPIQDLGCR